MSLNCKEIDTILLELDLTGAQIQKIIQPTYDTLCFGLYKIGGVYKKELVQNAQNDASLLCCVAHGSCRLHLTKRKIPKPEKPQRFMELLRSQLLSGRIESIEQINSDRIIKITIKRSLSSVDNIFSNDIALANEAESERKRFLYIRLWSGNANIILCKADGTIIDVLTRKPQKLEIAGQKYCPETNVINPNKKEFCVRTFPIENEAESVSKKTFNDNIDDFYSQEASELSYEAIKKKLDSYFSKKRLALETRLNKHLEDKKALQNVERYKELADILLANQHLKIENNEISLDDFYHGGKVTFKLEKDSTISQLATSYYDKAKKIKAAASEADSAIEILHKDLDKLNNQYSALTKDENPHVLRAFLQDNKVSRDECEKRYPGLSFEYNNWLFLIGRSSSENDTLLRRHVKGSDYWFHARDYAGSYVFVKANKGKTVPLDIMLSAGMLAVYYSKGRKNGKGEVYYTQVKYLRRAKNGPQGLVIPTQEKNLSIQIDEKKVKTLLSFIKSE